MQSDIKFSYACREGTHTLFIHCNIASQVTLVTMNSSYAYRRSPFSWAILLKMYMSFNINYEIIISI